MKLAPDEINTSHLLDQTRREVMVEDDKADREQAAAVFQKFIENNHVVGILGPTLSDTALAVDPIAQQAGVPVLAISNAAGGLTEIGNFIFRDCLSESQLTPQTVKLVKSRLKLRSAALLYLDTDPNRAGSRGFRSALQDAHVRIAAEQTFQPDTDDFSSRWLNRLDNRTLVSAPVLPPPDFDAGSTAANGQIAIVDNDAFGTSPRARRGRGRRRHDRRQRLGAANPARAASSSPELSRASAQSINSLPELSRRAVALAIKSPEQRPTRAPCAIPWPG